MYLRDMIDQHRINLTNLSGACSIQRSCCSPPRTHLCFFYFTVMRNVPNVNTFRTNHGRSFSVLLLFLLNISPI